jgi:hypothetical protein
VFCLSRNPGSVLEKNEFQRTGWFWFLKILNPENRSVQLFYFNVFSKNRSVPSHEEGQFFGAGF